MSVNCKILNLTYLNSKTLSICLEAEEEFDFLAGQYVQLDMQEHGKYPFSIASLPRDNRQFELHLGGISQQSALASSVPFLKQRFKDGESVVVEKAKGNAWLRSNDRKLVLVAGGSGYTYTRSLLQEALKRNPKCDITLYWGCQSEHDLYEHDYLLELEAAHSDFRYVPVTKVNSNNTMIREGGLLPLVYQDVDFRTQPDLYICGRYEMVQTAYSHLNKEYDGQLNIYSDALPCT